MSAPESSRLPDSEAINLTQEGATDPALGLLICPPPDSAVIDLNQDEAADQDCGVLPQRPCVKRPLAFAAEQGRQKRLRTESQHTQCSSCLEVFSWGGIDGFMENHLQVSS